MNGSSLPKNKYMITEWRVVIIKYLGHLLPVSFGVEGGLSEQGGVLLRGHTQLIVKGVVPDLSEEGKEQLLMSGLIQQAATEMAVNSQGCGRVSCHECCK